MKLCSSALDPIFRRGLRCRQFSKIFTETRLPILAEQPGSPLDKRIITPNNRHARQHAGSQSSKPNATRQTLKEPEATISPGMCESQECYLCT